MGPRRNDAPTLEADAIAAAEALRRSETAVVEVLRGLEDRRAEAPDVHRVEQQLRALIEVAAAVAAAHSLTDVLERAAEHALAASGAASVSISRWYPETGLIQTLINVGEFGPGEERLPENEVYRAEDFPLWKKLFDGVPQLNAVDDPASDPGQRELLARLGKVSSVGVAIRFRGEVWGELWATTSPGQPRFSRDDVIFLQTIAEQIGSAIGRAELFDRISELAYRDPLTGLGNRRTLDEALTLVLGEESGDDVALLMCDVDGLKPANDELGHAAGDAILIRAAQALRAAAGSHREAVVCRVGGDEFCVLLPSGGLQTAREVALAAGRALSGDSPPVTMSCGAAAVSRGGSPAELLRAADAAQYRAKHRGDGVCCFAGAEDTLAVPPKTPTPGRRRSYRDRDGLALEAVIRNTIELLDGPLARAPVEDRLRTVATAYADLLYASRCATGLVGAGGIRTLWSSDGRGLTREALDDPSVLVVRAAANGRRGDTYVVVLFTGEASGRLRRAVPGLRLLALAAVAG